MVIISALVSQISKWVLERWCSSCEVTISFRISTGPRLLSITAPPPGHCLNSCFFCLFQKRILTSSLPSKVGLGALCFFIAAEDVRNVFFSHSIMWPVESDACRYALHDREDVRYLVFPVAYPDEWIWSKLESVVLSLGVSLSFGT